MPGVQVIDVTTTMCDLGVYDNFADIINVTTTMCDLGVYDNFADIINVTTTMCDLGVYDNFCRYQKCLRQGMLKEGVRLDRVHRTFHDHNYQDHQSKTLPS